PSSELALHACNALDAIYAVEAAARIIGRGIRIDILSRGHTRDIRSAGEQGQPAGNPIVHVDVKVRLAAQMRGERLESLQLGNVIPLQVEPQSTALEPRTPIDPPTRGGAQ